MTIKKLLASLMFVLSFLCLCAQPSHAQQKKGISVVNQTKSSSNPTVSPPQKWEYRILQDRDTSRLEREANRLGEQGFEIFAFQVVQPFAGENRSGDTYFVMVFKRPKT